MSDSKKVKAYLVDDEVMVRAAMGKMLQEEGIEVSGESGDGRAAVEEIREKRPDVVVLDITMPGLSGLDVIPLIRKAAPHTKVLMLSHHEGEAFVEQALRSGAEGYLSKSSDPAELAIAVRALHRGDPYVSPRVAGGLVTNVRSDMPGGTAPKSKLGSLTARERQVFQLLATGKSNKEVAWDLQMTVGTAKKHRENLQRKLQCTSAAELARLAIREGLLTP